MKNRVITMNLKVDGDGLLSYPPPPPPPPPRKSGGLSRFFWGRKAGNHGGSAFVPMKFCMEERL